MASWPRLKTGRPKIRRTNVMISSFASVKYIKQHAILYISLYHYIWVLYPLIDSACFPSLLGKCYVNQPVHQFPPISDPHGLA